MVYAVNEKVQAFTPIASGVVVKSPAVNGILHKRPEDNAEYEGQTSRYQWKQGQSPVAHANYHWCKHDNGRCWMDVREIFEYGILE